MAKKIKPMTRTRGKRRIGFTVVVDKVRLTALDQCCQQLSKKLGYRVTRSMYLNAMLNDDKAVIAKERKLTEAKIKSITESNTDEFGHVDVDAIRADLAQLG